MREGRVVMAVGAAMEEISDASSKGLIESSLIPLYDTCTVYLY